MLQIKMKVAIGTKINTGTKNDSPNSRKQAGKQTDLPLKN